MKVIAHCGKSDDHMNQMMSAAFFANLFSCSALRMLQAMSQAVTQPENVDQMWSRYASKVLISECALDGHSTLEQLSNYEFQYSQDKRNLLAGMPFSRKR